MARLELARQAAKVLRRLGAVTVAAALLGAVSAMTAASPANAATIICKGSPIPSGYVITAEGSSLSCPGTFPNTWSILVPANSGPTVICSVSPIPPGFVITAQGFSAFCPGTSPNTLSIVHA